MVSSAPRFCTNCGAANRQQAAFCFACGQSLQDAEIVDSEDTPVVGMVKSGQAGGEQLLKDRYRILRQLGKGGMGAVYKAEDTLFGDRAMAVKEMSQAGLSGQQKAEAAADFKREAHMLADLHHPGLPKIYDYFSEAGQWYLVMDFIEGETLEEYLARKSDGWLPVKEVLEIGQQLCTVLQYLHTCEPPIIFRDLKPANIMRTPKGKIVLIDFGIARNFKPGQLRDTVSFGSAGYAAPEQYGKTQTTPRSDIYSLGVILHQCLTGNDPANNSPTPFDFPPLELHGQSAPAGLGPLITQMLAMNPNARPASMSFIWSELDHLMTEQIALEKVALARAQRAQRAAMAKDIAPLLKPGLIVGPPIPDKRQAEEQSEPVAQPSHLRVLYGSYQPLAGVVYALACSPDGKMLASGEVGGAIQIWDQGVVKLIATHQLHASTVRALAWSPTANVIASGDESGLIVVWQVHSGLRIYRYRGNAVAITGIAWSPDGKRIAAGDTHGRVLLQDAKDGQNAFSYNGHQSAVRAVSWSPDGNTIASGDRDGQVHVWDVSSRNRLYVYGKQNSPINALAFDGAGKRIAAGDDDGVVQIWDVLDRKEVVRYRKQGDSITALAWSRNGEQIALGCGDGTVLVRHVADWKRGSMYREHHERITALLWLPDDLSIISASRDKQMQRWKAPTP